MEAIQFIHAFSPIISKAAMQTYYSALPLMPSDSLLYKKYFAMSRPSLKSSGSRYSQIIHNPPVSLSIDSKEVRNSTTGFKNVMVVSLSKGGIGFFDISTGNEIGSRIPTAEYSLIASSPDGRRIVTCHENRGALDIWNVQARAHAKTIAKELEHQKIKRIAYSVDGKKVMIVTAKPKFVDSSLHSRSSSISTRSSTVFPPIWPSDQPSRPRRRAQGFSSCLPIPPLPLPPRQLFIWDVKTDKLLKQLEVAGTARKVAILPDASQIVVADELGIKIIDVSTGHPTARPIMPSDDSPSVYDSTRRLIWSSRKNIQTSASASIASVTSFYTKQNIIDLACSPDSSKVVAILGDNAMRMQPTGEYVEREMTLSVWCMRSGSVFGTTSFKLATRKAAISFTADGRDILICCYDFKKQDSNGYSPVPSHQPRNAILLRFSVIPTHLETYMHRRPLKFHPSQTPHTIEYSRYILGAIDDIDYSPHVDADGWIINTKGEREIWTPWANYELLCSCKPPPKGETEYRTLEVRDPNTKTVVLIYVITFGRYHSKPLPVPPGSS